ncbi:TonB-dependent receptor [Wenyingzhuangia sp. 1_MG-2023]|nr:TonB-dependent receptor [Wenyingzhuangia sp. 1_MG-2023]
MKKKDNLKGHRYAFLQFDLKMKISLLFLVISVFQIQAKNSYSQNKKVTLEEDSATILQIIQKIESSTDYSFFYSKEEIDLNQKVSVFAHDELVESVLGKMFFNTEIGFKVLEEQIVLTRKTKNNTLKNKSLQQGVTIKGIVKDDGGMPVPGANVVVKGTNQGVITDFDGNYQIAVNTKNAVLVFSYVGYKDKEVIVGNQTTINVALEQDVSELDAVVMVGYGTVKKSDITGAVSSVNTEDINKTQNISIAQAIQGRAAGVSVSKSTGAPGATPTVRIRGVGTVNDAEPLYVVDGVPINDVSTINMEDAQSIEVLKDASATAIYGSRGANGVILITTKEGKKGKSVISYRTYVGVQNKRDNLDVLNAEQWATIYNEALANDGEPADPDLIDPSSLESYNWKDAVYRTGIQQNHQLSASGGTEKSTYYVSFGYVDQKGIVKETNYNRTNFRVNNTYQIKPKIKLGHSIQYANAKTISVPNSGEPQTRSSFVGYIIDPVSPLYNTDGSFGAPTYSSTAVNPLGLVKYGQSPSNKQSFLGNVFVEFDILKGLKFRSNYGLQINNTEVDNFTPAYSVSPVYASALSRYVLNRSQNKVMILSNTLNYNTTIKKKHSLNALLGQEIQELNANNVNTSRNGIPESVANPTLSSGDISSVTNSGTASQSKLLSFFGRLNYSYDNRYLLTATYRLDGSSRFGANNKWAQFPSFALAWNLHNEKFYDLDFMNQFKLRAGWGETGNQNIPATATYDVLNIGTNYTFGSNDDTYTGVAPLTPGNPDLKWETTKTTNIGVDMAFLDNSITFSVEYFLKNTTDMLMSVPILYNTGYNSNPYGNVGDIQNKGLEITANYKKTVKDFSFNVGGNISFIKNKVIALSGEGSLIQTGAAAAFKNISRTEAGHSLASFYGYEMLGIFQNQDEVDDNAHLNGTQPGDVQYRDINEDGVINDDDKTYIGSPFPKFTYGINMDMSYKQFDFSAFFQGSQGNKIFNASDYYLEGDLGTNMNTNILNRWTGEGTSNSVPRVSFINNGINSQLSSRYVKDGSYLRLKNIQLGYNLPKSMLSENFITSLRFYVAAQNLLTFTKYDGLDPELGIDTTKPSVLDIGIDRGRYPTVKTFSLGLDVNF